MIRTREPSVDRYIFWTFDRDQVVFNLRNNIFVFPKDIHVFGPYVKPVGHVRTRVGEQNHEYNLFYSPGNSDPIGIARGKGEIIADPLFVDAASRNFRLKENSPGVNSGVDMGYEYNIDGYAVSRRKPNLGSY